MAISLVELYETRDFALKKQPNQANQPMNPQQATPNVLECNSTNTTSIKCMMTNESWRNDDRKDYDFIAMKGMSLIIIAQRSFNSKLARPRTQMMTMSK